MLLGLASPAVPCSACSALIEAAPWVRSQTGCCFAWLPTALLAGVTLLALIATCSGPVRCTARVRRGLVQAGNFIPAAISAPAAARFRLACRLRRLLAAFRGRLGGLSSRSSSDRNMTSYLAGDLEFQPLSRA